MISVIVPHHLTENQPYLTACLKSLETQDAIGEVLVIADSRECPIVPEWVRLHYISDGKASHFARKINVGVHLSDPRSTHYMIMSDDTVAAPGAIQKLKDAAGTDLIVNAMSNWDDINVIKSPYLDRTEKFWKLDNIHSLLDQYARDFEWVRPIVTATNRLYFFATMIPKGVWNKLGELDTRYESGWEDEDYCLRAAQQGVRCGIALHTYIHHFGGKTVDRLPRNDTNKVKFKEKWGVDFIPPLTMPGFGALLYQGLKLL